MDLECSQSKAWEKKVMLNLGYSKDRISENTCVYPKEIGDRRDIATNDK